MDKLPTPEKKRKKPCKGQKVPFSYLHSSSGVTSHADCLRDFSRVPEECLTKPLEPLSSRLLSMRCHTFSAFQSTGFLHRFSVREVYNYPPPPPFESVDKIMWCYH